MISEKTIDELGSAMAELKKSETALSLIETTEDIGIVISYNESDFITIDITAEESKEILSKVVMRHKNRIIELNERVLQEAQGE